MTAMKALRENFPVLVHKEGDVIKLSVRFLNASAVNKQVLNLGTGFVGMNRVISTYGSQLKHYGYLPLAYPVILIVDNDTGGEKVLNAADSVSQQVIKPSSTDTFFHIHRNLYLVKTPPGPGGSLSAIEDCFPEDVLKQKIGAKSFDPKKRHGDETSFGKQYFAEQIVRPGVEKFDFNTEE